MNHDATRAQRTVWHHNGEGVLAIGVWTERNTGRGEDAEPLLAHHIPTAEGILGVFDGLGGSGAEIAHTSRDGTRRSSAWIGARVARIGVDSWFRHCVNERSSFEAQSLRVHLAKLLAEMRPLGRSKIVGSMRRSLPSTMAAIRYRLSGEQAECQILWAGDSRAYALNPRSGLQALTRDHTVETDGLEQLLQDPPLTNVLCADRDFTIDSHVLLLDLPCVLVCATDGFYGYVDTPAHFECHLLNTLQVSGHQREWAERLARQVSSYSGDDASLSLAALGFSDFEQLRESFGPRTREIDTRYQPRDSLMRDDPATVRQWRTRTWSYYRSDYEQLMPPVDEGLR
ncbi:hypothetical protein [Streptosporangium sp. KLBMP 9127]|nr:hypothetical protein [Streptosporangium sp. KLBMP 9127]